MRTLERNKQTMAYALYVSKAPATDDYGYYTGETTITYGDWVTFKANISAAKGESVAELFGASEEYDKVIVTDDMACPIDEYTVLAVDITPTRDKNNSPIYDYVVKKVAKSLNSISYAISKVKVTGEPAPKPTEESNGSN